MAWYASRGSLIAEAADDAADGRETVHNRHHKLIQCYIRPTDTLESDLVPHDEHDYLEHCAEAGEGEQDDCVSE